jgi:pimeloyl-ACP methyl ester carboxylesterase
MPQFDLTEIITKDKLVHQGIYFPPSRKASSLTKVTADKSAGEVNPAILWVHGLTSTFYADIDLFKSLTNICKPLEFGFAAFNNRGHDLIAGIRKIDKKETKGYGHVTGGAGYEEFSECVYDIDAGISFLVSKGYQKIILIGHSSGANKVCYYSGLKNNSNVTGVILLSPVSDRLDSALDKKELAKTITLMKKYVTHGHGDELMLGFHFFPMTPRRFLSLLSPHSTEDIFDYGDSRPRMTYFSKIIKPLMVVFGENDEYLDRSAKEAMKVFDKYHKSKNYKSYILPGALHGYDGKEKEISEIIIKWISQII